MAKTSKEALDWIHGRLKLGNRPGLKRVEALLTFLGNPEKNQKFIHIAGTNGKGSTVKFLATLLQETGLKVGTYTSPYIVKFNERMQIDGEFISDEELLEIVNIVQPIVTAMDQDEDLVGITEFEINTAIGFLYFKRHQVDVAVIEVGLGGLLDSTNVISPQLCGITTIGLDHMNILGNTLEEIAFQKAGIIKQNIPVITGNIAPNAQAVIEKVAAEKKAVVTAFAKDYQLTFEKDLPFGESFSYAGPLGNFEHLKINLIGRHQIENAGMALTLFLSYAQLTRLHYSVKEIKSGLLKTFWPARMEVLNLEPFILLDGAHNDHAVKRLVENVKARFKGQQLHILYSAINTKDIAPIMADLKSIPNCQLTLTTFEYPKALTAADFAEYVDEKTQVVAPWQKALPQIVGAMDAEDILIITGSLYFSSQVREVFKGDLHAN